MTVTGAAFSVKATESIDTSAPEAPGRVSRWAIRLTKGWLDRLLVSADIRINGSRPSDPQVRHPRFYVRLLRDGSLGAGEAYVAGEWECQALDELAAKVAMLGIDGHLGLGITESWYGLQARLMNRQRVARAFANGQAHYERGDALYSAMLGTSMTYSCAYWSEAKALDEAQEAKLQLICEKLQLQPGQRVLDIGCGWGSLARYAAKNYGVHVVGVTISPSQAEHARQICAKLPVQIRMQDYRQISGVFDRVVSVGMFEHVGPRNYATYMKRVYNCLKPQGLFLLHTIGTQRSSHMIAPWVDRYIFPGAVLPAASQIARHAEPLFVLEDWQSLGADYDRTLMAWYRNFEREWPSLRPRYNGRFFRLWRYYLLTSAGAFRARRNQLWQVVLSKGGVPGGYRRPHL